MKTSTQAEADALYHTVAGEAARFAAVCTLSVEDMRQTLYLFCLEHAQGVDNYNALLGEVRPYIMGRMWGLIERWRGREFPLDSDIEDGREEAVVPEPLRTPSVEQELIEAEQRRVMEAVLEDMGRQSRLDRAHLPTVAAAICGQGLTERAAARLCGSNSDSGRLRQRLREMRKHRVAGQGDNSTYEQPCTP